MSLVKHQKKIQFFAIVSGIIFISNIQAAFGQSSGNQSSSLSVTRSAYLTLINIPNSFAFKAIRTPGNDRNLLSDFDTIILPENRKVTVQDNRNGGGFILQVSTKGFVDPEGQPMPNSIFRVISSPNVKIDSALPPTIVNNVIYENGFIGDTNVKAPINANGTNFSDPNIFILENDQNNLSKTVDILQGPLPSNIGRKGKISVGLSFNVLARAFTKPNSYTTHLTYTLIDATTDAAENTVQDTK